MTPRVLCIWLPNWPIQRAQAAEPSLASQPLILEKRDPRRGMIAAAANYVARRCGASVGKRMSELAAIVLPSPSSLNPATGDAQPLHWQVRSYRPDEDLDALCTLCDEAQRFSPLVGIESLDEEVWAGRHWPEPEALLLDVTGVPHLFGGEHALMEAVSSWLRTQRLFAYMAIASNVGAAWAMASYELKRRKYARATSAQENQNPSLARSPLGLAQTGSSSKDILESSLPVTAGTSRSASAFESVSPNAESTPALSRPEQPIDILPAHQDSVDLTWLPISRMLSTEVWEEEELLAELPVESLRVHVSTVTKLQRLGVRRLCELWQLPRDGLASRLGEALLKRSDQALGILAEPIVTYHASPDWQVIEEIEFPTFHRQTLEELLRRCCETLSVRLERRGEGAIRIVCRMDLVQRPPLLMQLGLYRASHDSQHLASLLIGQLEQAIRIAGPSVPPIGKTRPDQDTSNRTRGHHPLRIDPETARAETSVEQQGVWRISLHATETGKVQWEQADLFDDGQRKNRHQLAELIDQLSGRLGRERVVEARIERNAEPELAVTYRPLTGRRRDGKSEETIRKIQGRLATRRAEPSPTDPLRRPTQLVSPPERLLGEGPESSEGPISNFVWNDRRYFVTAYWGPERLESGWWRGPSVRREYFRVECKCGQWLWIFRDLTSQVWYLAGLFG